jgi:hypothetical protein
MPTINSGSSTHTQILAQQQQQQQQQLQQLLRSWK